MKFALLSLFSLFIMTAAQAGNITLSVGQTKDLPECGGSIEATESAQGAGDQVNLVFRSVENCSNFDILANNFEMTNYKAKKLQDQKKGRGGSFTIPKKEIGDGLNMITVNLKSNSGAHSDNITVMFNAYHIPSNKPSDPVVVTPPSAGGGW